jgi:hypothetical protein
LVDRRGQTDQDQAGRRRDGPRDDQSIAEIELVDRNPKANGDDPRPGGNDT